MSEKKKCRFCLTIIVFWVFISFGLNNLKAQDTTIKATNKNNGVNHVRWVSQFPSSKNNDKGTRFTKRITRILFGKDPVVISKPINILAKNPQTFWVLDQGNGNIIQVKNNAAELSRFNSKQLKGFKSLVGICSVSKDVILFTDSYLNNVYKIDFEKKELLRLNDSLSLKRPTGIAYSKIKDEIWVVETGAHRITVLNKKGEIIKRIGHRGNGNGEFNFPTFIWIDQLGNVYVVDSMNFRIQIFNKNGEFLSTFGKMGDATGYFARPKGIATDTYGNIYIADALFHVVQIFDKSGNFLYQFGGQGQAEGQFWMPGGIFIDDKNYIYVADSYNSRVQVFQLMKGNLPEHN